MDEWHSRQSHKRILGVPDCVSCAASPLIKEFNTAMSAIRKKVFVSLKEEHTESCEINQLLTYEQPTAYIVTNDEYSTDTTLIPVLTANKGFVLGYTDEDFSIYQKGECIIFDDFTMDAKYVSFPFKVKSSAIKILTAKPCYITKHTKILPAAYVVYINIMCNRYCFCKFKNLKSSCSIDSFSSIEDVKFVIFFCCAIDGKGHLI